METEVDRLLRERYNANCTCVVAHAGVLVTACDNVYAVQLTVLMMSLLLRVTELAVALTCHIYFVFLSYFMPNIHWVFM